MTMSNLRLERLKAGKSQIDLWVDTGIQQWRISLIERGVSPRPDEIKLLSKALNIEPYYLFPAENHPETDEIYERKIKRKQ